MREHLTNKEFNQRLASVCGKKKLLDHELQALLEDALYQASHPKDGGHGSCNKLDHIINSLKGQRSWPMQAIKNYISAHTSARWGKLDDGRMGYSYGGNPPSVTMPTETWMDHKASNENGHKAMEIHVASRINRIFADASKEGASVDDMELLEKLKAVYKQHKADKSTEAKANKPEAVDDFDVKVA